MGDNRKKYAKAAKRSRRKKWIENLPGPVKGIGTLLGWALVIAVFVVGIFIVETALITVLRTPWVASLIILGVFLVLTWWTKGWTKAGTAIFIGAVAAGTFLDLPGNPIYNAPFEQLFLQQGEYLAAREVIDHPSQGEVVISGQNIIVDDQGNELRTANQWLVLIYRFVLYTVIYSVLLTIRGRIPLPEFRQPS